MIEWINYSNKKDLLKAFLIILQKSIVPDDNAPERSLIGLKVGTGC